MPPASACIQWVDVRPNEDEVRLVDQRRSNADHGDDALRGGDHGVAGEVVDDAEVAERERCRRP